jgi:SNARE protein
MEIRLVQDIGQRRNYEARLKQLDQNLQTIQSDVKALESDLARGSLFEEVDLKTETVPETGADPVESGDAMLKEASALQDKTQKSLLNTRKMIAESKQVGVVTLDELQRQRGTINTVEIETKRVDDNLARSETLLKAFGRRIAGDRFIQFFLLLLFVAIIVYVIIIKVGGSNNTTQSSSTSNTATRYLLEVTSDLTKSTIRDTTSSVEAPVYSSLRGSIDVRR